MIHAQRMSSNTYKRRLAGVGLHRVQWVMLSILVSIRAKGSHQSVLSREKNQSCMQEIGREVEESNTSYLARLIQGRSETQLRHVDENKEK